MTDTPYKVGELVVRNDVLVKPPRNLVRTWTQHPPIARVEPVELHTVVRCVERNRQR